MKITFISTLLSKWGGSEVLWVQCVENAVSQGHQVQVVVFAQTDGYHSGIEKIRNIAQSFVALPNPLNNSGYLSKAMASIKNKILPFKPDEIINFNPDTILVNQPDTYSSAFNPTINSILNAVNKPFFLFSHFNADHEILSYPDMEKARNIFAKAKAIYFVSQRNLDVAQRQLAMTIKNASVIGNHPDISKFNLLKYPPVDVIINFGSVARLEAQFKGQDILLQVLSAPVWKDRQWMLNFYGTGPDEKYLKELTAYYGLTSKVKFHGHVSNIKEIWANNHLLLMASTGEGKPLALEEAMACGRVAVVSDVAGNKELVDDGINGFLASSYFPEPFAEALEIAWQKKNDWPAMGVKAQQKIADTIDVNPQQTLINNIVKI